MKNAFTQTLCRLLAVVLMLLPWQTGQASMIGTEQATSTASVQADRDAVASFLSRTQAVNELSALGIDAQTAKDRVAAMSDGEVSSLAGKIAALPAGGDGLVLLVLVLLIVWLVVYHR
jgi:hypothetical protein